MIVVNFGMCRNDANRCGILFLSNFSALVRSMTVLGWKRLALPESWVGIDINRVFALPVLSIF